LRLDDPDRYSLSVRVALFLKPLRAQTDIMIAGMKKREGIMGKVNGFKFLVYGILVALALALALGL